MHMHIDVSDIHHSELVKTTLLLSCPGEGGEGGPFAEQSHSTPPSPFFALTPPFSLFITIERYTNRGARPFRHLSQSGVVIGRRPQQEDGRTDAGLSSASVHAEDLLSDAADPFILATLRGSLRSTASA